MRPSRIASQSLLRAAVRGELATVKEVARRHREFSTEQVLDLVTKTKDLVSAVSQESTHE